MPARRGRDYITRLKEQPAEVWLRGERVKDVTGSSATRSAGRSESIGSLSFKVASRCQDPAAEFFRARRLGEACRHGSGSGRL
jgi:hypothetical protein